MSYEVENWVRHNTTVKAIGPRFLLMTMANMADVEGYLWGTNEHFASVLGVTIRAVQKYSSILEVAGAIEKLPQVAKNGRTMNNAYRILTPGRAIVQVRSKEPGRVNGRSSSPPEQAFTLPLNTCSSSPCTPVHPHRETVPQKPPTETNSPPSPLTGGAAPSARVTQAERTAIAGLQALKERLWTEQRRHVDRKIGRAIKSRLRAGESIGSLWADYFELRPSEDWDPPKAAPSSCAAELLEAIREDMRPLLSIHSFATWLAVIQPIRIDSARNQLVIAFPSRTGQYWLEMNYGEAIREAAKRHTQATVVFWQPGGATAMEATA